MMQPPENAPDLSDETIGGMPTEHPHCAWHGDDADREDGTAEQAPAGAGPATPGG